MKEKVEKTLGELRSLITGSFDDPRGGFTSAFVDQLYVGRGLLPDCLAEAAVGGSSARTRALANKALISIGGRSVEQARVSKEQLWEELISFAEQQGDPEVAAAVSGILRGEEKHVRALCEAIIPHLSKESMSVRCSLAADLRVGGRKRMRALGEILVRRRGTEEGQRIARAVFHAAKCTECGVEQKQTRCRCGCRRHLCRKCSEVDGMSKMILAELVSSS